MKTTNYAKYYTENQRPPTKTGDKQRKDAQFLLH